MFKRYIKRHGKKLGPYYYENVRSPNGRIKTVYVGTTPSQHPKHRIRKPLVFLIVVLLLVLILGSSLFLLQNKSYLINKVKAQEPDFDIDQLLLKVLIKSNEFIEKQVRITNIGNGQIAINSEVLGLDIVSVNPSSFTIKPGQTKIVVLNFSSFMPELGIEQQPGVYVGKLIVKSEKAAREIPMVVEIETKNLLFDMNLNPVAIERKVRQGSETTIEVRLFNLESIESQNVDVGYFVKDMNSNTILTESETVVVKTQASFFKTVSIPKNLKPGPYVFAALAKFGTSVGTASYLFEVVSPEEELSFVQFCRNSLLCLGLSLTTILLMFVLTVYFYFFLGAYLYEKLTGVILAPKRKDEEEFVEEEEPKIRAKEEIERRQKELKEEEKEERPVVEAIEEKRPEMKKWFASLFKREKPEIAEIPEKLEEDEPIQEKPVIFTKTVKEEEKKEKPLEFKKPKSEVEELEEAIRNLGLFKKIETGKIKPTEKLLKEPGIVERLIEKGKHAMAPKEEIEGQKPEARESVFKRLFGKKELEQEGKEAIEQPELIGKSRQFKKCYNVLNKVKEAIANGNIPKANKIYVEAREIYIGLEDGEKKDIYDELMELYNKLR